MDWIILGWATFQILMMARAARMSKEFSMLEVSPPPGAQCWKVLIWMCFVSDTQSSGWLQDWSFRGISDWTSRNSIRWWSVQAGDLHPWEVSIRATQAEVHHLNLSPKRGHRRAHLLGYSKAPTTRLLEAIHQHIQHPHQLESLDGWTKPWWPSHYRRCLWPEV